MLPVLDPNKEYLLTTVDNPYDPFTEWDKWFEFDRSKGYDTPGLLDRIAISSHELSQTDEELSIHLGMLRIIQLNPYGVHKMVERKSTS